MNSSRKTLAAILAALMFGATVPTVCASAQDLLSLPQSGTIEASKTQSSAEFATETGVNRLVSVKRVERRTPSSISLTGSAEATVQRSSVVRRVGPFAPPEAVDRNAIRGRAPPV